MIEILRLTGNQHEVKDGYLPEPRQAVKKPIIVEVRQMKEPFAVVTLEGTMEGKAGDFLITGIRGEMYPCDREIFLETYEFCDIDSQVWNEMPEVRSDQ